MDPHYIFTLVHGTFAPQAPWTQPGSQLCQYLEQRFPGCAIVSPTWSGVNTHSGRLKAATDIGRHLLDQAQKYPGARQFVIAHSHGGTITLHACEEQAVRSAVSGVITMGTPFIHSRRRDLRVAVRLFRELAKLGRSLMLEWCWVVWLLLVGLAFIIFDIFDESRHFVPLTRTIFTTGCLAALLGAVVGSIVWWRRKSTLLATIAGPLRRVRAAQRQAYAFMHEPYRHLGDLPLLAIAVDRDEARAGLLLLRALGGLAHFVHEVLSGFVRPAVWVSFGVGMIVLVDRVHRFYHRTPELADFLMRSAFGIFKFQLWGLCWLAGIALTLHVLMIAWPTLRFHRLGYGEQSIWPNWLLDIHVRKSPGFGQNWSLWKARSSVVFGRHSFFYNDVAVMQAFADWIEQPSRFGTMVSPEPPSRLPSPAKGWVVRVAIGLLLLALAAWLWLNPIRIYHIHS